MGTSILKVKATDADSGANADLEYLVSDDHFSVGSSGLIVNNKQLDADNNNAYYEFIVTAKDKGKIMKKYLYSLSHYHLTIIYLFYFIFFNFHLKHKNIKKLKLIKITRFSKLSLSFQRCNPNYYHHLNNYY